MVQILTLQTHSNARRPGPHVDARHRSPRFRPTSRPPAPATAAQMPRDARKRSPRGRMLPFAAPRRRPSGSTSGSTQKPSDALDPPTDSGHGSAPPLASGRRSGRLLCLPLFYRCSFRTGASDYLTPKPAAPSVSSLPKIRPRPLEWRSPPTLPPIKSTSSPSSARQLSREPRRRRMQGVAYSDPDGRIDNESAHSQGQASTEH